MAPVLTCRLLVSAMLPLLIVIIDDPNRYPMLSLASVLVTDRSTLLFTEVLIPLL